MMRANARSPRSLLVVAVVTAAVSAGAIVAAAPASACDVGVDVSANPPGTRVIHCREISPP